MDNNTTIVCRVCNKSYPATPEYFHYHNKKKGYLRKICKTCACGITQTWRNDNPDKVHEWRNNNPDYQRKWYEDNREAHLSRTKTRYLEDPQRKLEANDRWRHENPEHNKRLNRAHAARRRARKRKSNKSHSATDIELIYRSQKGLCWWCGKELNGVYEVDHRIPLSRGGSNAPENLCISCVQCNRSKRAKLPHEWNGRLL